MAQGISRAHLEAKANAEVREASIMNALNERDLVARLNNEREAQVGQSRPSGGEYSLPLPARGPHRGLPDRDPPLETV